MSTRLYTHKCAIHRNMDITPGQLEKLRDLLSPPVPPDYSSDEDDLPKTCRIGPADIAKTKFTGETRDAAESARRAAASAATEEKKDDRVTPEYNIAYSQAVRPEDIFLQMGPRTPATASCESLVVKVKMPGQGGLDSLEADVTAENTLEVRSPSYRLSLPLPHPADHTAHHHAHWDPVSRLLTVTVRLRRELDYVNF